MSATIISIGNQKGGVGKTTLSALLANSLSQDLKMKILAIDCDGQGTFYKYRKNNLQDLGKDYEFSYPIKRMLFKDLHDHVLSDDVINNYDVVIVDMPGALYDLDGDSGTIKKFIAVCDIIFLPIIAYTANISSSMEYYLALNDIRMRKKKVFDMDLDIYCFLNRKRNVKEYEGIRELLASYGLPLLKSELSDSIEYQRISCEVKSLMKSSTSNPKLYNEYGEWVQEVEEKIMLNKKKNQ